jgi:ubiquinone/menaquinone biosynthesis C-methylase UbiE
VSADAVGELKQKHHATWAAGDYNLIAQLVEEAGRSCVEEAEIEPGQDVLDVACGTGNATIAAAGKGAKVTGLDLTPELFDVARQRAAEAGVEIEWVEGDAEDLPYEDESFDRVLSAIGIQFAPRHDVTAKELARVCRPGGLIVLANWTADGKIGELFKLMGRYMPKPPDFVSSPALWGDEDHVRGLFDGLGVELSFDRRSCTVALKSAEEYVDYFETHYGPTIKAKEALGPEKWEELRAEWLKLAESFLTPGEGVKQDYFVIKGRRA